MMKKKIGLAIFIILPIVIFLMGTYCSKDDKGEEVDMTVNNQVPAGSENWPSFRGVNGAGLTKDQKLPLEWDVKTGKNIKWSFETPGLGLSAPVIWGNRVFITTAVDQVADDSSLKVGLYGDVVSVENENPHTWEIICLDRDSGKVIWEREAFKGIPKVKRHPKSSHANSTPVTDGEHVIAFFGSEGLYCYDFNGNLLWKRDFGLLDSGFFMMPEAQWEFASSPIIHQGAVVIQVDVQKNSFIAALDIRDGKTIWKTDRDEVPTWSTPGIFQGKEQTQVVVNGFKHIGSYDFKTGKPIWWLKGGGDIPVPTPVFGFENVYITNAHGRMRPVYAIKLSATGDITPKDEKELNQHVSWFYKRKGAYMPTPILYGDYLYVCKNNGIVRCFEAKSGKEVYKQRVGTMQSAYSASPVATDGKIYFTDEYGDIHIVKSGAEFKLLKTNKLYESCLSTPAISGKLLFVRTIDHLFAIGKGGKTKGIQTRVEKEKPEAKIDFTEIPPVGTIKDAQELIKIFSANLRTISSAEYDISIQEIETDESTFGENKAKIRLFGYANGLPEYFHAAGSLKKTKETGVKEFIGGSDGNEFYYIDKDKKTIKKGVEYNDAGPDFQSLFYGLVTDFVSTDPLSIERTAQKIEIKGVKKINDEECYELYFSFPQYGNYELTWYISIVYFLPNSRMVKYTKQDGKRGGYIQTLSNLKINKHSKTEIYKIKNLKDYQEL